MDRNRFDALTRSLASRRTALGRLLAGGVLAGLGWQQTMPGAAAACPRSKKPCRGRCIPKAACCTTAQCRPAKTGKVCRRRRCVCPQRTKPCQGRCIHRDAACPPKPDAACDVRQTSTGTIGGGGPLRIAQTFTEPNGGRLIAAELVFYNANVTTTGIYQLQVNTVDPDGYPTNNTMATAQLPATQVPTGEATTPAFVRFSFDHPARLVPGRQYALVLSRPDGEGGHGVRARTSDPPCPGGEMFRSSFLTSFFEPAFEETTADLSYKTDVRP